MRRGASLDLPTIVAVAAGGVGLVAALVFLRFCGDVADVPAKPAKPRFDTPPERVTEKLAASRDVYVQTLADDARRAGLPTPRLDEIARAFPHRRDDTRHILRAGDPTIDVAGLRITAVVHQEQGSERLLALRIENPGPHPLAYLIDTEVSAGNAPCQNRTLVAHDGNVVPPGGVAVRSECVAGRGYELYIERVETLEIPPIAAFYLSLVPPQALGVEDRVGRGHRPTLPAGVVGCQVAMSQRVRRAVEDGAIGWRDLADFYARHPCATYQFPESYRAFTENGEVPLPAVDPG